MKLSKQICAATMAGLMAVSMAACGGGSGSTAASGNEGGNTAAPAVGETLGHALTYDTAAPVNNGEKIELTLWTDPEPEPYYQELAEKYHAIHENVTINVVSQPWSDYWTKLPLALDAGNGPDLYRTHPGYFPNLQKYSYELPADTFPMDQVAEDFPQYDASLYDGKLYTIPLGMTTGAGVYYNKDMWAEAGLTEDDIPTTWDKFEEVGKKLVQTDDKGNIIRYGFSIDHAFEGFIDTMNYSAGEAMFKDDLFTYNLDNETTYENIALLQRFKDEFMMYSDGDAEDQFGHGQVAMVGHWNWVAGYWNATYPELNWGFFLIPTKDGKQPAAYDRAMPEWTLTVSAADEAKRAVAFDVLKFYACEQNSYLDHAVRIGCVCANKNLVDDPKFDDQPNLKTISEISDHLVALGTVPNFEAKNKALRAAGSDIFINGKDPKEVIPGVMEQLNSDAEKNNIVFKSSENEFKYYDQLHK
mgnify:FL=1